MFLKCTHIVVGFVWELESHHGDRHKEWVPVSQHILQHQCVPDTGLGASDARAKNLLVPILKKIAFQNVKKFWLLILYKTLFLALAEGGNKTEP